MAAKKHKIGILGGTFDPVHTGHLVLAQSAYEQLSLERVEFIPSGKPPHKLETVRGVGDFQRIEMLKAAIADNNAFKLNTIEIGSAEPTYTHLTLQRLCAENPENDYYFILGEDSLIDFTSWRNPNEIVKYCHIVVGRRVGSDCSDIEDNVEKIRASVPGDYIIIKSPLMEISSSEIRHKIKCGESVKYYLPDGVYKYIIENNLYRE